MTKKRKQIIVAKEKAVFWMGENGDWFNEHGKLEHPKIIKHFHASIKKDKNGYYLYQETDEYDEKVYFPYKETALFVFYVKIDKDITLKLNNNTTIILDPEQLFEKDDCLYIQTPDDLIKFTDRALLKVSKYLEDKDDQLFFKLNGNHYKL